MSNENIQTEPNLAVIDPIQIIELENCLVETPNVALWNDHSLWEVLIVTTLLIVVALLPNILK